VGDVRGGGGDPRALVVLEATGGETTVSPVTVAGVEAATAARLSLYRCVHQKQVRRTAFPVDNFPRYPRRRSSANSFEYSP